MGKLVTEITDEIKPHIEVRERGINWHYYLHIQGGIGPSTSGGGKYKFVLWYEAPNSDIDRGHSSAEYYCKENDIRFGHGDTIEEAYSNYREVIKDNPLK